MDQVLSFAFSTSLTEKESLSRTPRCFVCIEWSEVTLSQQKRRSCTRIQLEPVNIISKLQRRQYAYSISIDCSSPALLTLPTHIFAPLLTDTEVAASAHFIGTFVLLSSTQRGNTTSTISRNPAHISTAEWISLVVVSSTLTVLLLVRLSLRCYKNNDRRIAENRIDRRSIEPFLELNDEQSMDFQPSDRHKRAGGLGKIVPLQHRQEQELQEFEEFWAM